MSFSQPTTGDPLDSQNNSQSAGDPDTVEVDQRSTSHLTRSKLDIHFLKPPHAHEENADRGWNLFLEVARPFPTLQERMESTGETLQDASVANLNNLLCALRAWTKREYPHGLSLRMFGNSMESFRSLPELYDYRIQLIRKYKSEERHATLSTTQTEPHTSGSVESNASPPAPAQHLLQESIRKKKEELLAIQKSRRKSAIPDHVKQQQLALKAKRVHQLKRPRNEDNV